MNSDRQFGRGKSGYRNEGVRSGINAKEKCMLHYLDFFLVLCNLEQKLLFGFENWSQRPPDAFTLLKQLEAI